MDMTIRELERKALTGCFDARKKLSLMLERTETRKPWTFDIEEGSLSPSSYQWDVKANLIIDPDERTVTSHLSNHGTPMNVWHHCDIAVRVPNMAHYKDVLEILEENTDKLDELASFYEGTSWNGSNHVGTWREGYLDSLDSFRALFYDVRTVINAVDYFCNSGIDIDIDSLMGDYKSLSQAVEMESFPEEVVLDPDDVEEFFRRLADVDTADVELEGGELEEYLTNIEEWLEK